MYTLSLHLVSSQQTEKAAAEESNYLSREDNKYWSESNDDGNTGRFERCSELRVHCCLSVRWLSGGAHAKASHAKVWAD